MALSATVHFKKTNWLECYRYHYLLLKNLFTNTLLLGASIIAGLSRYLKVWQRYFTLLEALNFGIEGDRVVNVIWQLQKSINTSITEKCGCIVWNQQPFHRFSYGYS